tara:strand:- start:128 stop:250 length:123 start_codon:yes stop_codon:yes gene_type:complete
MMSETIYIIPLTFYGIAMFCFSMAGYYIIKDLIKLYKDER